MSLVGRSFVGGRGLVVSFAIAAVVAIAVTAGAVHDEGLLPSLDTGEEDDEFGTAVGVHKDTAIVGAPVAPVDGTEEQGIAYVYTRDETGWTKAAELTAPNGAEGDRFGEAVDVHGDTAIVGTRWADVGEESGQGAAWVFEAPDGDWTSAEVTKLVSSDGSEYHRFGTSVAIQSNTAIVGALGVDSRTGAAYIYEAAPGAWSDASEMKLTVDDGESYDRFGSSVAIDEGTAVVGAPQADVDGTRKQGEAYVFTQDETSWASTDQTRLTVDGGEDDRFGSAVAVDGDVVVVGARRAGEAYVFTSEGEGWSSEGTLWPMDGSDGQRYGASVAVHGDTALVGEPHARVEGSSMQGEAHLFVAEDGDWGDPNASHVTAQGGGSFDRFGSAVGIHEDTLVVGAPNADSGDKDQAGIAYAGERFIGEGGPSIAIDEVNYDGDTLQTGETARITVTALAGGWDLSKVQLSIDGEQIAEEFANTPSHEMSVDWTPETEGTYTINATVIDEIGTIATQKQAIDISAPAEQPEKPQVPSHQGTFQVSSNDEGKIEVDLGGLGAETGVAMDNMTVSLADATEPVEGSVTVDVSEDSDEAEAPCQSDPTAAFVGVDHPGIQEEDIDEATLSFSVSSEELQDAGLEPDEVSLHRFAGQPVSTALIGTNPVLENAELLFPEEDTPPDVLEDWTVILIPGTESSGEAAPSDDGCGNLQVSSANGEAGDEAAFPDPGSWVALFSPLHPQPSNWAAETYPNPAEWEGEAFPEAEEWEPGTSPAELNTFGPGTMQPLVPLHIGHDTPLLALEPYNLRPNHEIHFPEDTQIEAFVLDENVSLRPAGSVSPQEAQAAGTVQSLPAQSAWESVPTEHLGGDPSADTIVYEAESPGLSLFVVAPKVPRLTVAAVNSVDVALDEGDQLDVDALIGNRGERTGSTTVSLTVGDTLADERSVTLDPGETTNLTLSWTVDDAQGTLPVAVDGHRAGQVHLNAASEDPADGAEGEDSADNVPFPLVEAIAAVALATGARARRRWGA